LLCGLKDKTKDKISKTISEVKYGIDNTSGLAREILQTSLGKALGYAAIAELLVQCKQQMGIQFK